MPTDEEIDAMAQVIRDEFSALKAENARLRAIIREAEPWVYDWTSHVNSDAVLEELLDLSKRMRELAGPEEKETKE